MTCSRQKVSREVPMYGTTVSVSVTSAQSSCILMALRFVRHGGCGIRAVPLLSGPVGGEHGMQDI